MPRLLQFENGANCGMAVKRPRATDMNHTTESLWLIF